MINKEFLTELIYNPLKISNLGFDEISPILNETSNLLKDENILVQLKISGDSKEILVIGDIHGNLNTLNYLIELIQKIEPEHVIFLGDLVDRGPYQLECLILVLCLKILDPKRYYILRGNHETIEMNQAYGFYNEFIQKFINFDNFRDILRVYKLLPTCILINSKILCLHGGIPTDLSVLNKLKNLKPQDATQEINNSLYQMIWNDPKEELIGFSPSYRGPGIFFFGGDVFEEFIGLNQLDYVIRAHECFIEGYRWFFNQKLLSIFSSANYRGVYYPNPASYAIVKNKEVIPKNIMIT